MAQEIEAEGDDMFTGFASRLDPANLKPTMLQSSFNMRLERGTAQPRLGIKRLTDSTLNSQTMVGSGSYVGPDGVDKIALIFTNRFYIYTPPQGVEPGSLSISYPFPDNRTIEFGAPCDVVQALDKIYIFRGREAQTRFGINGTSTQSALSLQHATVANGATVTVTATWINGYSNQYAVNDEVTIFNIVDALRPSFNNTYVIKSVNGTTSFTFDYKNDTGVSIASGNNIYSCVVKVKPPLVWDGTTVSVVPQKSIPFNVQTQTGYTSAEGSVPPSDFALYFQNRLVCNITTQQLAVSDILSDVFDFTLNNFILNDGGNDSIVGVLPWTQNQFIAFMRKSIYLVFVDTTGYGGGAGDPAPGAESSITVLSTEVGCFARRSIVSAGQFVFFLSAKGVHMLTPQLDLKLLGNTLPLSEPIADFFESVNYQYAQNASSTYYNNRFYIALPCNEIGTFSISSPVFTGSQTKTITCTNVVGFEFTPGVQYVLQITKGAITLPDSYNFLFGVKNVTATGRDSFTYTATGQDVLPLTLSNVSVTKVVSRNNRVLVYNTLNQNWESIDFYAEGFFCDDFAISGYINQRRLMLIKRFIGPNDFGGVFVYEELSNGDESSNATGAPILTAEGFDLVDQSSQVVSGTITSQNASIIPIAASMRTREYTFGTISEKRFSRGEFQFSNVSNDRVSVTVNTHDPDVTEQVLMYSFSGNTDGTLRPRIALRGSSMDVTIRFITGRPALKGTSIYSILANRPMISQE